MSVSKPLFSASGFGAYTLHWESEHIAIRVDRLREDSSGHVSGEIKVVNTLPGAAPHLHQAHFNLSSTSARATLAKHLFTRLEHDWGGILEQTCALILEAYRTGEPVYKAGNDPIRSEEEQYLVAPLLPRQMPTIFFGPGGVGKSYLALYLALVVNIPLYGNTQLLPQDDGPVLYLDYEMSLSDINDRIVRLKRGIGMGGQQLDNAIDYRFCSRPVAQDIEEIQQATAAIEPKLVIVDSVGSACGVSQGDPAEGVLRMFGALRTLKTTVLLIDHVTQDAGNGTRGRPYGSVYKINQARSIWEVRSTQEPSSTRLDIGLYHRKANTSALLSPLAVTLRFDADAVTVEQANVHDFPALTSGLGRREQIEGLLAAGAMTTRDMYEALHIDGSDISEATIRATLNQNKTIFQKLPNGSWGLKEV